MSDNKKTIEKYIDGFQKSDHAQILSCLADNVVWEMPGIFHLEGKEAFDGEIENHKIKQLIGYIAELKSSKTLILLR